MGLMAVQMAVLEKERTDKKCKRLQCKKLVTEVSSGWLKLGLAQYFERNKLFPGGNSLLDKVSVKLISFRETFSDYVPHCAINLQATNQLGIFRGLELNCFAMI